MNMNIKLPSIHKYCTKKKSCTTHINDATVFNLFELQLIRY